MKTIGLVACVREKGDKAAPAGELYRSALFKKARDYVEARCDEWYLLSGKHGFVDPATVIEPYNETLREKSKPERKEWADLVWEGLRRKVSPNDRVVILAGDRYREFLEERLQEYGCCVEVPFRGLSIGRQLQWLKQRTEQSIKGTNANLDRFYELLSELETGLGGKRRFSDATGTQPWPERGVYFVYEPGEFRRNSEELRVVRIGTHQVSKGSTATLWGRLRTHRGGKDGRGNHRGSVFRKHAGSAIAQKNPELAVASWGKGSSAGREIRRREERLEREVSRHIRAMSFLWLDVGDAPGRGSDRAYLEKNLIGLLSSEGTRQDPPGHGWLGRHSPEKTIRDSGLWNLNHVWMKYDPQVLEVLREYVDVSLGRIPRPSASIAPKE